MVILLIRKVQCKFANHFWSNANDTLSLNSKLLQLSVSIYLLLLIPILVISLGRHFYLQTPWMEAWSFFPSDPPGYVNIEPEKHAFGIHYFGDFLLPISWANYTNPYLVEFPVNYPPLAIEAIGAFLVFGYKGGLFVFLALMVALSAAVVVFSIRQRSVLSIATGVTTLGIASGPLLAAVDRGNIAGYLVGVLFLSGYLMMTNRWKSAVFFIAIATSIKLYAIVLLLIYVANRRWSDFFYGLIWSILLVMLPLGFYSGSFEATLNGLIRGVSGFSATIDWQLYCWNNSLVGGLFQLSNVFGFSSLSSVIATNSQLVAFALCAPIVWLIFKCKRSTWLVFTLSSLLMSGLIPISYLYTLTWALVAVCLIFVRANQIDTLKRSKQDESQELLEFVDGSERKLLIATLTYLCVLLVPMPISLPTSSIYGCTVSIMPMILFLSSITWVVFLNHVYRREVKESYK